MEVIWDVCAIYSDVLNMYITVIYYMLYLLSSPYLLVIGDDRVRGTHGSR